MTAREKLLKFIADNEPDYGKSMGFAEDVGLLFGEEYLAHAVTLIDAVVQEALAVDAEQPSAPAVAP